ncbi:MAG TPA: hypothetical protein VIK92_09535 [Thermaerobacter sp.]
MEHTARVVARYRRPGPLVAALSLFVAALLILPLVLPPRPSAAPARQAAESFFRAWQAGDLRAARTWVAASLARARWWPHPVPPGTDVTGYSIGEPRVDLSGRVHLPVTLHFGRAGPPSAARFFQDTLWLDTPRGARLVGLRGRLEAEVTTRDDVLHWQEPGQPARPVLALADLPASARPAGGPAGVSVATGREGFGPLALVPGGRRLLLTTTGNRPLVALWDEDAGSLHALDVLYQTRALQWQTGARGRYAALVVETADGARTFLVYDLQERSLVPPRHLWTFPTQDYHHVLAGWVEEGILFDVRPRQVAPGLLKGGPAPAGRWRLDLPEGTFHPLGS